MRRLRSRRSPRRLPLRLRLRLHPSSDERARRSRSHPCPREELHSQARLPREWRQAGPKEHAARRG
eukprot:7816119-Pyramimonas_sp.AAC.1